MFARTARVSKYLILIFSCLLGIIAYNLATRKVDLKSTKFNPYIKSYSKRFSTSSSNSGPNSADSLSSSAFKYNVAVAFQPKDREENKLIRSNSKSDSKSSAESFTGEDNYFVAKKSLSEMAAGVADGVGGWNELGYDSSAISRELCNSIKEIYLSHKDQIEFNEPKSLLEDAFNKILREKIVKVGGTTACLGVFKPDGILKVANLGDSWCGVFRNYSLILETKVQTHAFNTPFQLAIVPKEIKSRGRFIMDKPIQADEYEFKLKKDDIVIFATDGVIDNIDTKDIEIFLNDNKETALNELSKVFVDNVVKLSKDEAFPSVFSQELSRLTGQFYSGGKEDDITVVFVKVD
ncbi:hypothetical protein WICMUC_004307 [Wickerhamomyces mucosus]|uniref:Protein phosphatase n=1 Tax=Wickerhamomyces mucosus TaxID=1378264 RepID=A0A9P8TBE9_9ASCO|nr:hypothetical protein WICMUC_004307 [Wickerhamomyces mucosus]